MKKFGILILTIGVLLSSFASITAKGNKGNFDGRNKIIKKLNLTDQQLDQFKKIHLNQEEKKIDIEAKLKKNKLELKKLLVNKKINKQDFLELTDKANDLMGMLRKSRVEMWFEVYKILDENQKQIWINHFSAFLDHDKRFGKERLEKMRMKNKRPFKGNPRFQDK